MMIEILWFLLMITLGMLAIAGLTDEEEEVETGEVLELPEPTFTFETSKPEAYSWR